MALNLSTLKHFDRGYSAWAQQVARMKRQRNAGETTGNAIYPRIPLRSIRATHGGCHGVGA